MLVGATEVLAVENGTGRSGAVERDAVDPSPVPGAGDR